MEAGRPVVRRRIAFVTFPDALLLNLAGPLTALLEASAPSDTVVVVEGPGVHAADLFRVHRRLRSRALGASRRAARGDALGIVLLAAGAAPRHDGFAGCDLPAGWTSPWRSSRETAGATRRCALPAV